jgi:hypothetical protein
MDRESRVRGVKCTVSKAAIHEKLRALVCAISGIQLELTGHPYYHETPFPLHWMGLIVVAPTKATHKNDVHTCEHSGE